MIKPRTSLFAKILSWFFLNLILLGIALGVFFTFQPQMNLYSVFRQQGATRLRIASMLISYDMEQSPQSEWPSILARHAKIHQVDFALILEDGSCFFSTGEKIPDPVLKKAGEILKVKPPWDRSGLADPSKAVKAEVENRPNLVMRTSNPTRYWFGNLGPLFLKALQHPASALLLAVSDSPTGHGFFFDPLPWMIVTVAVILISVLLWVPMVRHITRPLVRMTRTAELIAKGRFDVSIHEPRADEIGRLATAINHMTSHLSDFVKGQKRFLGDVAHELGSPIARVHFGLAALESRVQGENRERVGDIMEDMDHMSQLVNELLAFSRAEMNKSAVRLEPMALLPAVEAAVRREASPQARIIVAVDPEIRVIASAELLTRALANIIRNAVKYAGEEKKDGAAIRIEAKKIKEEVLIEICDSGPGVPEDLVSRLFEPFFRPEPSRDRDSGGVGLGLAIVKTCIETCKGGVSARNLDPEGFCVAITLSAGIS
ncbi:MAG: ATP-binding protein [Desulfatirhabdiaceae bacterium]